MASQTKALEIGLDSLCKAITAGEEKAFLSILRLGTDLSSSLDSRGWHPLHVAILCRRKKMLVTLLKYKERLNLNVNIMSSSGHTPLQLAQYIKAKSLVTALAKCPEISVTSSLHLECPAITKLNHLCLKIEQALKLPREKYNFTSPAHALTSHDITQLLPEIGDLAEQILVHLHAIFPYKPWGAQETRYLFPNHFPKHLPGMFIHKEPMTYGCRFLHLPNLQLTDLCQTISHILSKVHTSSFEASLGGFHFLYGIIECHITVKNGIAVQVHSEYVAEDISKTSACLLYGVVGFFQELMVKCGEVPDVRVMSRCDVAQRVPQPHTYPAGELTRAEREGLDSVIHPQNQQKESLKSLMWKTGSKMPEDHIIQLNQLATLQVSCGSKMPEDHIIQLNQLATLQLEESVSMRSWSLDVYRKAITDNFVEFTKYMNIDAVITNLITAGFLNLEKAVEMNACHYGPVHACINLFHMMELLQSKDIYTNFLQFLQTDEQNRSHQELWTKLMMTCKQRAAQGDMLAATSAKCSSWTQSLENLHDCTDDVWIYKKAFERNMVAVTKQLNVNTVLPHLIANGCLNLDDIIDIWRSDHQSASCLSLFCKCGDSKAYRAILHILQQDRENMLHQKLWKALTDTCKELKSDINIDDGCLSNYTSTRNRYSNSSSRSGSCYSYCSPGGNAYDSAYYTETPSYSRPELLSSGNTCNSCDDDDDDNGNDERSMSVLRATSNRAPIICPSPISLSSSPSTSPYSVSDEEGGDSQRSPSEQLLAQTQSSIQSSYRWGWWSLALNWCRRKLQEDPSDDSFQIGLKQQF